MLRAIRRQILPLVAISATLAGCIDIRDFAGTWSGPRVGDAPALRAGFDASATATLVIDRVDLDTLNARLTTSGDELVDAEIRPIPGAEADVLAGATFDGSPARVFFAFAATEDGAGDALVVVALYDDGRVEVRIARGGDVPLYAIFALDR